MDNKLVLSHAYRSTLCRILPPTDPTPNHPTAKAGCGPASLLPPRVNPATARLHPTFPSLSVYCVPDSSRAITTRLTSVYLPLYWGTPRPTPPIRNHLPVDAVAHRMIPFTHGLFKMSMINSHLVAPTPVLPHQSLMTHTYSALKKTVRDAPCEE